MACEDTKQLYESVLNYNEQILWHLLSGNVDLNNQGINHQVVFEICLFEITAVCLRRQ